MPQVIDALVVELGLDPSKFTQGQKDALEAFKQTQEQVDKGGKNVEAHGKKINDFFSRLKTEALTLGAAFLGGRGIKEFVQYITDADAKTGRFATTLNMTSQELSTWEGVVQKAGGSAGSATSAFQGLSSAANTFMITGGQGPLLPIMNQLNLSLIGANNKLKTAGELTKEVADSIAKLHPEDKARAAANLALIPGMNQDTINALLLGPSKIEKLIEEQQRLGTATKESVKAAQELSKAWGDASQAAESLGRSIYTWAAPALTRVLTGFRDFFIGLREGKIQGNPDSVLTKMFNNGNPRPPTNFIPNAQISPTETGLTREQIEAKIRAAAIKRGIDPNIAVEVARREGLNKYVGDQGTSFGPFQLHYKNNIPGLSNAGLGDKFTRDTGLHASDPSTVDRQIDFSLDYAKKNGWGAWHGWKGLPYAGISGGSPATGASGAAVVNNSRGGDTRSTTSSTKIDQITVNTQATDAKGIARDIGAAFDNVSFAGSANSGLR